MLTWLNNLKSFANVAEKYYYEKSDFFKLMQMTDENTYAIVKQFKTMEDFDHFIIDYVEEEKESLYAIINHPWFPIFHPKRMMENHKKLARRGRAQDRKD